MFDFHGDLLRQDTRSRTIRHVMGRRRHSWIHHSPILKVTVVIICGSNHRSAWRRYTFAYNLNLDRKQRRWRYETR